MPQNKPMKIQWISVNGRQVPLVLPQTYSYADDDWKVTSDRDPLPVVEYGTTAGGIVVPKRVSDEGHELTQLTGSLIEQLLGENIAVPVGSYKAFTVDIGDCNSYNLAFIISPAGKFKVDIRKRSSKNEWLSQNETVITNDKDNIHFGISDNLRTQTAQIVILFHNNSNTEMEIMKAYINKMN